MRVFVSSLITGMEGLREVIRKTLRTLDYEPVMAEDFGASPHSPRIACLEGVRSSGAYVLICGDRYGEVQDSGYSATHEEYLEAKKNCQIFAFIQKGKTADPKQAALIKEVKEYAKGFFIGSFESEDDLQQACTKAFFQWATSKANKKVDEEELLARASAFIKKDTYRNQYGQEPGVQLIVSGSPAKNIIRPSELESDTFISKLALMATFGEEGIFTRREGTEDELSGDRLIIKQKSASIMVDEQGTISIIQRLEKAEKYHPVIVHENVIETLYRSFKFAHKFLEYVDSQRQLWDLTAIAVVLDGEGKEWRTREQDRKDNHSFSLGIGNEKEHIAYLSPSHFQRAELGLDNADRIKSEDLATKLKRSFKR